MKLKTRIGPEKAAADLAGQQEFSARLVLELARRPGNLFVSPYSAWCLLAMLQPGARRATRKLLDRVLGIEEGGTLKRWSDPIKDLMVGEKPRKLSRLELQGPPESFPKSFFIKKRPFDLIVANALWLQQGYRLRPEYIREVKEQFDARLEELDLTGNPVSACDTINGWASENTRGRIPEVLSPGEIHSLTRLILTNATYFKDEWVHQFKAEDTEERPFHGLKGFKVKMPMMHQTADFGYFESRTAQAVRLPYANSGLTMTVVLPKDIRMFEASMTHRELERLFDSVSRPEQVFLALPKYRFEDQQQLIEPLNAMGLAPLFDDTADLSGISREPGVHVNQIKQLTWVQIDEKGTEAAAVTVAMVIGSAANFPDPDPKIMIVDRPYWFFIRDDRSGTMLFAGRVEDPS